MPNRSSAQAAANTRENLAAGRLDLHRDGFGFVRLNPGQSFGDDDIFVPPNEINGAMQGDQVLVELGPPKRDGRREGRIARILERKNPTVVGIFHYARKGRRGSYIPGEFRGNFVTPFDSRMAQPIVIPEGAEVPEAGDPSKHRVLGSEAHAATGYDEAESLDADSLNLRFVGHLEGSGSRRRNHQLAHANQARLRPRSRDPPALPTTSALTLR